MGIFDFFRKSRQEEKFEEIRFEEFENWFEKRKVEVNEDNALFSRHIQGIAKKTCSEFEDEIEVLEKIDLSQKKENDRAKLIIQENLNYYINYLKKLKEEIEILKYEEKNPDALLKEIDSIFSNFKKRSSASFQKATYLIGKEIEQVQNSIMHFYKSLEKAISDNKKLIEISSVIQSVDERLDELNENRNKIKEINTSLKKEKISSEKLSQEINNLSKELKEIETSKEYKEENIRKSEINEKKRHLEKEVYRIKEMIDFKELMNFFHSNEKEMKQIKKFYWDFKEELNHAEELINLLDESKFCTDEIMIRINNFVSKKQEIKNQEDILKLEFHTMIVVKQYEIQKKEKEFQYQEEEKEKKLKKLEKIEFSIKEIEDLIRKNLEKINVILK